MSKSYQPQDSGVSRQTLRVQELNIPFYVTHNATPSSVSIASDQPGLLFLDTQGVTQITVANGATDNAAEQAALSYTTPNDATGLFNALIRINEPVAKVISAQLTSLNNQGTGCCGTGYLTPGTPGPGVPNLNTAATYAGFASSTITNTGSTVLTGNLGMSPGSSVTGFPPGTIVGTTNVDNAAAVQAKADAQAVYTQLASMSPGTTESDLDGLVLTPGTYTSASSMSLATSGPATLTLNGAGVYVFQIGSTLTTGAGGAATITLTGGAQASQVFWQVGSSATLNVTTGSTFQGNVIANTSITLDSGDVKGSLIALNGAFTISAASTVEAQLPVLTGGSTGISLDGNKIVLNFLSGGDFATTDYNGCITVKYIVSDLTL